MRDIEVYTVYIVTLRKNGDNPTENGDNPTEVPDSPTRQRKDSTRQRKSLLANGKRRSRWRVAVCEAKNAAEKREKASTRQREELQNAVIPTVSGQKETTPTLYQSRGCDVERSVRIDTMLPCVTFWGGVTL